MAVDYEKRGYALVWACTDQTQTPSRFVRPKRRIKRVDPLNPTGRTAQLESTNIARQASGAIAGGVIILIRRQLGRMARRIGHRICQ